MPKSKSAYSVAGKKGKLDTHIIVVWVDNEAGVLARVVGLFSGRGYNIESLAVAEVDSKLNISRITIVTTGTPEVIDQIKLQLKKLVPVHKVASFKRDYGIPGPGSMFGPKALAVVKKLISGEMQPKQQTRVSAPVDDADPVAVPTNKTQPQTTNREKGIMNRPEGGALYSMQGASSLAKQNAEENMTALINGPYKKMVSLFGQPIPVRDAIAKAGSSRERSTPGSQHFHGNALDLNISRFNNTERLQLVQAARKAGFKGFGFGKNTLHVDIGRNRYWDYGNSTFGGVRVARVGQYVTSGVV